MTRRRIHGHAYVRGKNSRTRTYQSWQHMKDRCFNTRTEFFRLYGGRGITVCERWLVYENFLKDMGERPEGLTLERIDNNGNYEPGNCRWATPKDQALNRRNARINKRRRENARVRKRKREDAGGSASQAGEGLSPGNRGHGLQGSGRTPD